MTTPDREELIAELEASRRALNEAVAGVADEDAARQPEQGWSVLGCVEHCALAERGMLAMIARMSVAEDTSQRPSREEDLRALGLDRNRKLSAPEAAHPASRYATVEVALSRFNEARDRTIAYVQQVKDDMRGRVVDHPVGRITARECLWMMIQHPRRHSEQIRELISSRREGSS